MLERPILLTQSCSTAQGVPRVGRWGNVFGTGSRDVLEETELAIIADRVLEPEEERRVATHLS